MITHKLLLLLLWLGLAALPAQAQAPFTGGPGDGYDRVSLHLSTHRPSPAAANLRLFPQPASAGQWLTIQHPSPTPGHWQLFDAQGRLLRQGRWTGYLQLDTQALPPGLYHWRVQHQPVHCSLIVGH